MESIYSYTRQEAIEQTALKTYQEVELAARETYEEIEHAALKKYQEQEVEIKKNENDRGEEMETIKVVKKIVNGQETTSWDGETTLEEALRNKYGFQGKLYAVFNVDEASSKAAGWHPSDTCFSSGWCGGWKKFIEDRGKIETTETAKMVSVEDLIFPPV